MGCYILHTVILFILKRKKNDNARITLMQMVDSEEARFEILMWDLELM